MHWAYALYLFACTAHAPIFLTLVAVGKYVPCARLAPFDCVPPSTTIMMLKNKTNAAAAVVVVVCLTPVKGGSLSDEAGAAAILAVIFALMFMSITTLEDSGSGLFSDIAVRVCFWCFVWFQGCVMHCSWPAPVLSSDLYLATGLRLLALWCLCRTAPGDKGWASFACSASVYLVWLIAFFKYYYHYLWPPPLIAAQLVLDALLALGHRYDEHTTRNVILNCRLCYVGLAGCIAHVAALCMS